MEQVKRTAITILKWISIVGIGLIFIASLWQLKNFEMNDNFGYTIGRLLVPGLLGWLFWSMLPFNEKESKEKDSNE